MVAENDRKASSHGTPNRIGKKGARNPSDFCGRWEERVHSWDRLFSVGSLFFPPSGARHHAQIDGCLVPTNLGPYRGRSDGRPPIADDGDEVRARHRRIADASRRSVDASAGSMARHRARGRRRCAFGSDGRADRAPVRALRLLLARDIAEPETVGSLRLVGRLSMASRAYYMALALNAWIDPFDHAMLRSDPDEPDRQHGQAAPPG